MCVRVCVCICVVCVYACVLCVSVCCVCVFCVRVCSVRVFCACVVCVVCVLCCVCSVFVTLLYQSKTAHTHHVRNPPPPTHTHSHTQLTPPHTHFIESATMFTHLLLLITNQEQHWSVFIVLHVSVQCSQADSMLECAVDQVPVVPHCS